MEKLEQITSETCAYKIQALRIAYPLGYLEKCRNCPGEYYVTCERYKPVSNSQIPVRKGLIAYKTMKGGN